MAVLKLQALYPCAGDTITTIYEERSIKALHQTFFYFFYGLTHVSRSKEVLGLFEAANQAQWPRPVTPNSYLHVTRMLSYAPLTWQKV